MSERQNGGPDLRDWFAGQALMAILASPELMKVVTSAEILGDTFKERVARKSYEHANAMLAARERKGE